ncbi:MAG: Hemolysin [Dehalococcoidia bacterium]|nr:Hemolysin [Dehalococcoidia bacterium]
MNQVDVLYLILLFPCLLLSAFFSISEASFLSLRKVRIRHLVESRAAGAERVARMMDHPEKVIPTILLGNNMVNTAFAALATVIAVSLLGEGRGVIAATAASTVIVLVLGETLPKMLAIRYSETVFFSSAGVLEWIERLLLPLLAPLQWANRMLARRLGSDPRALFTEEEIKMAISMGREAGELEEHEEEMLKKVFRFGDRPVREMMTPRTDIVWIKRRTTLKEFLTLYQDHPHSRFPVFEGHVGNVVGILSLKDLVATMARGVLSQTYPVTESLQPVFFTPDIKPVGALFREMQEKGGQMALVVDEFGGVDGLVTMKQLIEVVVGRVGEEGMQPDSGYKIIDENTFDIDGDMRV